jgi:hypothetical protein
MSIQQATIRGGDYLLAGPGWDGLTPALQRRQAE